MGLQKETVTDQKHHMRGGPGTVSKITLSDNLQSGTRNVGGQTERYKDNLCQILKNAGLVTDRQSLRREGKKRRLRINNTKDRSRIMPLS